MPPTPPASNCLLSARVPPAARLRRSFSADAGTINNGAHALDQLALSSALNSLFVDSSDLDFDLELDDLENDEVLGGVGRVEEEEGETWMMVEDEPGMAGVGFNGSSSRGLGAAAAGVRLGSSWTSSLATAFKVPAVASAAAEALVQPFSRSWSPVMQQQQQQGMDVAVGIRDVSSGSGGSNSSRGKSRRGEGEMEKGLMMSPLDGREVQGDLAGFVGVGNGGEEQQELEGDGEEDEGAGGEGGLSNSDLVADALLAS